MAHPVHCTGQSPSRLTALALPAPARARAPSSRSMAADAPSAPPKAEEAAKAKAKVPVELSAEDSELKAALLLMVERAADKDAGVQRLALESLRREIRTATRCALTAAELLGRPPGGALTPAAAAP